MITFESNNRTTNRVLELQQIDGKKPLNTLGLVDHRLFSGENKLRACRDDQGLWYMKYDSGVLPPALRNRFTTFTALKNFAEEYFNKRNIVIKEVVDAPDE